MQALKEMCQILNEALEADPQAITALLSLRVPCNETLAAHPTIQVRDEKGEVTIGTLGLLNGMSPDPNIAIAAEWETEEALKSGKSPQKFYIIDNATGEEIKC